MNSRWSRNVQVHIDHSDDYHCIAGNFCRRKLSQIGGEYDFHRENFCGLLTDATKQCYAPNFTEKTFTDNYNTSKSTNIFSLKSYPLYCMKFQPNSKWRSLTFFSCSMTGFVQVSGCSLPLLPPCYSTSSNWDVGLIRLNLIFGLPSLCLFQHVTPAYSS